MSQGWRQNWSGHTRFRWARVHEPASVAEIQRIVAGADAVGIVGAAHSFNDVADTDGDLLWLGRLAPGVEIDHDRSTVSFNAGLTYAELCPYLHQAGLALANMASLPHITVAGACATATHGSGDRLGNLATAVSALELVTADGDLRSFSRADDDDVFGGVAVSLGALGVVVRLTLDLEPAFRIRQHLYSELPFDQLYQHFDQVTSAGYSVSLFPTWQHPWSDTVWVKQRLAPDDLGELGDAAADPPATLFGARLEDGHPRPALPDRTRTPLGPAGPWHERLPHFQLTDPTAVGDELQSEYFVPRRHAVEALRAVAALGPRMSTIIEVSEIRTVAGDGLWLSPAYGQDVVAIHFNWQKNPAGVLAFLPELEAALAPFEPRPHWGKLATIPPDLVQAAYPRLGDFRTLAAQLDPDRKFANRYRRTFVLD